MDSISPTTLLPIFTLLLGIVVKAAIDALTERRKAAVDREARLEKRKEVILLQRIDRQRKYLEALQETAADLARCCGMVNHHDFLSSRKGVEWGKGSLEEGVNEKFRVSQRQMTIYSVRVEEEEVRQKAEELSGLASKVALAKSEEASDAQLRLMGNAYAELNTLIGETLRTLESNEQALFK